MAQPSLKLEQRHRLLRIVELAGDGGSSPVAGDVAADVSGRHARLGAECRDDANVQVLSADSLRPVENSRWTRSLVLRSRTAGWAGRTTSQAAMACPRSGRPVL